MTDYPRALELERRDSVDQHYGPRLLIEAPELEQREAFAREVLGTADMGGAALEVGCGMGYYTNALAERFDYVIALDRSKTQCIIANAGLYALGRRNVSVYVGTLPVLAAEGDVLIKPKPNSFSLVASLDGLRRPEALDLAPLAEYASKTGMVLVAHPGWWFGDAKSDVESKLYEQGLRKGWSPVKEPSPGPLEPLDGGELEPEAVTLPYVAAMSGLTELYDFKRRLPHPEWKDNTNLEITLAWRLYHLANRHGETAAADETLVVGGAADDELTVDPDA